MAIQTKDDVLNKMITEDKPECPHCKAKMAIWECPPANFGDGLGWGTPYLYVCFNDECCLYVNGWESLQEQVATVASYRCICDPMTQKRTWDAMPVFSKNGGRGYILDEKLLEREHADKKAQKEGLAALDEYEKTENVRGVLDILLAPKTLEPVAFKAAELIEAFGDLDVIEPLRNCIFENDALKQRVEDGIASIHQRNFTKECPYCAEIIKSRAVVCKHCGKDLSQS